MCPPKQAIDASSGGESDDTASIYDSIYDSEDGSITDTLTSQWFKERTNFIAGRRYHKAEDGTHAILPNDETQQEAEDLMHSVYMRIMAFEDDPDWDGSEPTKLHHAPIPEKPHRILDVGTGTGIWAIDCAEMYPSAEVVGFDQSPIQPSWVPPNCKFEVEDIRSEQWTWTKNSFDLAYARAMHTVVEDWPKLCRDVFSVTKPGGFFEIFSEIPKAKCDDKTMPDNHPFVLWIGEMERALNMIKNSMYIDETIDKDLTDAGFTNIVKRQMKVPIGPWAKDKRLKQIGAMFLVYILQGIEGWSLYIFTKLLGKTEEETRVFITEVKKSLRNKKVHCYLDFIVVHAQKPEVEA